jgi:hypothetical protein
MMPDGDTACERSVYALRCTCRTEALFCWLVSDHAIESVCADNNRCLLSSSTVPTLRTAAAPMAAAQAGSHGWLQTACGTPQAKGHQAGT